MHTSRLGQAGPASPRGISPTRNSGLGLSASASSTYEGIVARLGLGSSPSVGLPVYRPGLTTSPAANSPYQHQHHPSIGGAINAAQSPLSQIPPRVTPLVDPISPRGLSERLESHSRQILKAETMKERTERLRRETASLRQSLAYSPRPDYSPAAQVPTPTRMDPPAVVQPAATPVWASPSETTEHDVAAQEKSAVVKLTDLVSELKRQLDKAKNESKCEVQKAEVRIQTLEQEIERTKQNQQPSTPNNEIEELKERISKQETEIATLTEKVSEQQPSSSTAETADLEAKVASLEQQLQSATEGQSEAHQKISDLEAVISNQPTQGNDNAELEAVREDLKTALATVADLESKLSSPQQSDPSEELLAAKGKIDELEAELSAANTAAAENKAELAASQEQLSRLAELEEAGSNWKAKIEELTAQIEQQQESSPNSRMSKLEDENETANAAIAELTKKLEQGQDSSKRVSELEERSALGDERISELTLRLSELEQTNEDQRKEIEALKQQQQEANGDSVASLKQQLATVEAEKESLSGTAKEREQQIADLQNEVERLTITVQEPQMMEMTITTLRSTISQLQDSQNSLKKQLQESEKRNQGGNKNHLHPYSNSCNESACNFSDVRYEQSVDMSSITDRSCSALSMKSAKYPPPSVPGPVFYLAAMIGASGGAEASPSLTLCLDSAPRPGESPADHASRVQGEKPVVLELPNSVHDKIRPSVNAVDLHCDDPDKRVIQIATPRSKMVGLSMLHRSGIQMQEYAGAEADFVIVQSPGVSEHSDGSGSDVEKEKEHEKPVVLEVSSDIRDQLTASDGVNAEYMGSSPTGIHMLKLSSPRSKMNGLQLLQNAGLQLDERTTDDADIITATGTATGETEVKQLFAGEPLLMGNLPAALEDSVRSEIAPDKVQTVTLEGIEMLSISSPRSKMIGLSLLKDAGGKLTEADLESNEPIVLGNLPQQAATSITTSVESVDTVTVNGIQMLRLSSPRSKMTGLSLLDTARTIEPDTEKSGPLLLGNLPDNLISEMKEEIPNAKEVEGEDGSRMLEIESPRSKMESIELLESAGLKTLLTDKEGIDMLLLASPRRGRGVSILRRAAADTTPQSDSFYVAAMIGAAGGSKHTPSLTRLLNTEKVRES